MINGIGRATVYAALTLDVFRPSDWKGGGGAVGRLFVIFRKGAGKRP